MKIAQVVCVFPPYKGGIGTMAYNHARSLAAAGHDVDVLTPDYRTGLPEKETRDGFNIIRLNSLLRFGNAALCLNVFDHLNKYDVVHLHYPFFGTAELVWLWKESRGSKAKLVITYHMDVVGKGFAKLFFWLHRIILMPFIIRSADKVIVTSVDYADESFVAPILKEMPEKFIAIVPEVDSDHFRPTDFGQLVVRHGLNVAEDKIILFVGGLDRAHYFKGLELLIGAVADASKNITQVKLAVVGSGELLEQYRETAAKHGIGDRVIFVGAVSYGNLPQYYSLADLLVVPAIDKSEAFGIVSIEALSCGTPILTAGLPGVRTVSEGGVGDTFKTGDREDLADKIVYLLKDGEKLEEMGRLGREKVLANYSQNIIVKKLLDTYNFGK